MNTQILQKCLDALEQKKPDISYIRGMLETLISLETKTMPTPIFPTIIAPVNKQAITYVPTDEEKAAEELARKYVGGPIGNIG